MACIGKLGTSLPAIALAVALGAAAEAAPPFQLEFLGQEIFPTGYQFAGTVVGGLSGIDHDPASNSYLAISDDRSPAARFYSLTINLADGALGSGDVTFTSVTTLTQPGGTPYVANSIDPEAIRRLPGGGIAWSSEGEVSSARIINPAVFIASTAGEQTASLTVPAPFLPQPNSIPTTSGVRNNLAFESLTLSADKTKMYVATENALVQDGLFATVLNGTPNRIIEYDVATGTPGRQFVYVSEPVALLPNPITGFATNGLVEMLAVDDTQFLMLERSFSAGAAGTPGNTGNTVRLFLASLAGASDVSNLSSLLDGSYVPMSKELVIDFTSLGIPIDNVEGMTFGETLADGTRTLIFVSDNNFNATQFTQFLAFAVKPTATPVPVPAALPLFTGGVVAMAWFARRRRR
jgi:hypothetical protein